jgi:hypothetical protein
MPQRQLRIRCSLCSFHCQMRDLWGQVHVGYSGATSVFPLWQRYACFLLQSRQHIPFLDCGKMSRRCGCSKERSSTRRICQLALFARSSHCSSGNVTPLAANAIVGSHAIEQYCVRAVGTSHEVNRGLSWMPPRCGRSRVNGIRVRALCRPSSNLGRNLFPPRRFSYHTRFSRFNGTARQPSPRALTCTNPQPALRAVVRCSQDPAGARPSKCYYYYYYRGDVKIPAWDWSRRAALSHPSSFSIERNRRPMEVG